MQDNSADAARQRAQMRFEKATAQAREAAAALKDHNDRKVAEAAKVAKLRALRLARDAAEAEARDEARAAEAVADVAVSPHDKPARKKAAPRRKTSSVAIPSEAD